MAPPAGVLALGFGEPFAFWTVQVPGLSADLTAALGESRKAVKRCWRVFSIARGKGRGRSVGVGVGGFGVVARVDVGVDVSAVSGIDVGYWCTSRC